MIFPLVLFFAVLLKMAASYNVSNITELFSMLESNNADVAREMKQAIYEQYDEGEPHLVVVVVVNSIALVIPVEA